jgi:hypothetical protein
MRKRFALAWSSLIVVAALLLPASVLASQGVFYRIVSDTCEPGEAGLALRFVAKGGTAVNRFKVRSWAEQRPTTGGTWTRVFHWPQIDQYFTVDGTRHSIDLDHCYADTFQIYTRIVVHLQAYDANGIVWGGIVHGTKI